MPRQVISPVSSLTTRRPEIEASTTAARHTFVTIFEYAEDSEPPTLGELVVGEIDRPARVRRGPPQDRHPCSRCPPAPPPLAHRHAFPAVDPLGLPAVQDMALPPQRNVQPPVTEPATLGLRRPQALAQIVIVGASERRMRYRIEIRSTPNTEHARRALISWRSTRIATASGMAASVTTFATGGPSAQPGRAATPPAAASTGILLLKRLQPLRVRHLHPAELGLSCVTRRAADLVPAAQLRRLRAHLLLPLKANDLLLREIRSLHGPVLSLGRTLTSDGGDMGGRAAATRFPPGRARRKPARRWAAALSRCGRVTKCPRGSG